MPRVPFFEIVKDTLYQSRRTGTKDVAQTSSVAETDLRHVLIVGSPNVGKSVIFGRLTGKYVIVSNYPGTTVEISRGKTEIGGETVEVLDTPGMYSLQPSSEEERVGRRVLMNDTATSAVVHVVDAKNLERMLAFTLQLIEAGLPVVLAVNMSDEASKLGLDVDVERLSQRLGVPVVATVATSGRGIDALRSAIAERLHEHVRAAAAV
jgi:ferrous iron transport protein B